MAQKKRGRPARIREKRVIGVKSQSGKALLKTFAIRAKAAMVNLELSATQLAERAGMPKSTITLILTGKRDPRLSTMAKIATGLRLTVAEMLSGDS